MFREAFEDIANEDDFSVYGASVVGLDDDDGKNLEKLIETTARLGLTLPLSFTKLLKSEKLLEKLPTGSSGFVELFPLLKIRNQLDGDPTRYEEGYIFTWFHDQYGYYTHMYLDTAGRHAILTLGPDCGPAGKKE